MGCRPCWPGPSSPCTRTVRRRPNGPMRREERQTLRQGPAPAGPCALGTAENGTGAGRPAGNPGPAAHHPVLGVERGELRRRLDVRRRGSQGTAPDLDAEKTHPGRCGPIQPQPDRRAALSARLRALRKIKGRLKEKPKWTRGRPGPSPKTSC